MENLGTRLILEKHLHAFAVESRGRCMWATHSRKARVKLNDNLLIESHHKNAASHSSNTLDGGGSFTRTSLGINDCVTNAVLDPVENFDLVVARGHDNWVVVVIGKLPSLAGIILV
jgi:hypothetical protein